MAVVLNFLALLLEVLLCCPNSVTANPAFTRTPQDPSNVLEGGNITLRWNFTLDGTLGFIKFLNVTDQIGARFGPGAVTGEGKYQSRFSGQATNTQAELTILEVKRSDQSTYKISMISSKTKSIEHEMEVIVQYQSNITSISKNQTVDEGDMLWLNCTADGNPTPNITWTMLPNNSDVSMPLTITGKQDEGCYRCTADNKIGNSATADVCIVVRYQSSITSISNNKTVDDGDMLWLNCAADGNPTPRITWTMLPNNSGVIMPLTIRGKQDEGCYRCTADNGIGNPATADVFVFVESYRPFNTNFSTNLTNATLLNETLHLMCSAEANPAAEYRLYKDDESMANINHNVTLFATSVSERVEEVTFKCIPFNSFGDGPTKTITVTVHYPVEVTGKGKKYHVVKGGDKNITCPVDGNPKPNIKWYNASGNPESTENVLIVKDVTESVCYTCVASNSLGKLVSISQCLIVVDPTLTMVSSTTVLQQNNSVPSIAKPTGSGPEGLAGPPWTIIGAVTGSVVVLLIGVGVLTWWVHKQRKCRKDTKIHNSGHGRHGGEVGCSQVQGAYAQSGPPAANGTDSTAEPQVEAEAAIPTYAAVDTSKEGKKQSDERPPEYAVVDKSQKKEKQEEAAIPTYAAVDKSKKKKKKKSSEEVPAVYAEVDKSKKKKKKKIDDKNLYENLDEPKKEKKPGELLYADLGDFQNPSMPTVSTSPQPLPAIKKADPYERTDYADITQFLKGNATLPPNDGNGDTEMKPKRPSKNKIQGNDKETPI